MKELTPGEAEERSFRLGTVFKPTQPINREDLFAGRQSQIRDVVDTINQQGQHAVLYGERGVGKTSLANMIFPKLHALGSDVLAPQVNCMTQDTYSDIWKRVLEEIAFKAKTDGADFGKAATRTIKEYTGSFADDITPDIARRVLYTLGQEKFVVIILDEFDTVENDQTRVTMSDTIKFLSDRNVPATLVLVGVADDVETLVKNHRSLERCLRQILIPRMSDEEVRVIVTNGLAAVGMTIEANPLQQISSLSRGLPHYAHLLGLQAGRCALDARSLSVRGDDVRRSIEQCIDKAQASIKADYSNAITSSREEALYRQVLLACALADTDDVGWFYPKDVRGPLTRILGRPYKIESFARHLHAFSDDGRGPVLIMDDDSARPRFRIENPLMQPYVIIRGLAERLISLDDLRDLEGMRVNPRQQRLY